jgi:hypothetical protein
MLLAYDWPLCATSGHAINRSFCELTNFHKIGFASPRLAEQDLAKSAT